MIGQANEQENEQVMEKFSVGSEKQDNWGNRNQKMRCGTCIYFVNKTEKIGRCRRNAPTMAGWPVVFPTDWCGNHKIDETKI